VSLQFIPTSYRTRSHEVQTREQTELPEIIEKIWRSGIMAKSMVILSINAGSSSVKATLFKADGDQPERIAAAEISCISSPPAQFTYTRDNDKQKRDLADPIKSHYDAFDYILESFLNDGDLDIVSSRDHIDYACHRVVHGVSAPLRQSTIFQTLNVGGRVITQSTS
jgi:hypothetical protein